MKNLLVWCAVIGGILGTAPRAQGQTAARLTIEVYVVDSGSRPVSAVDLTLHHGSEELTRARTDSAGRASLVIDRPAEQTELVARRIGYNSTSLPVAPTTDSSINLVVILAESPVSLDTVAVTAMPSLRDRIYHLDSTTIATSQLPIRDGWDALRKLRPDVAYGRGLYSSCERGVQNVWINGIWLPPELVVVNDLAVASDPPALAAAPHLFHPPPNKYALSTLTSIKPEHIAEMTYRDCKDALTHGRHSGSALFIVLKNGAAFEPGRGSYWIGKP